MVGYAEIFAMMARRLRENLLQQEEFELLQEKFTEDWFFNLGHVELTAGVLAFIPGLVNRHPLQGSARSSLTCGSGFGDAARHGQPVAGSGLAWELCA